jgi:signal transduction histidine kinase
VQVDLGVPRRLDEIWLIPAHPRDYPERSGFGFPVRFRVEVDLSGDFVEPRVVFDGSSGDLVNPGDAKVAFASGGVSGRFIRVTALKLWERSRDFVFALSELEAFEGSENVTRNARVTASDSTETARWAPRFLVDGLAAAGTLIGEKDWIEGLSKRRVLEGRLEKLLKRQSEEVRAFQARLRVLGVGAVAAALGGAGLLAWRGRFVRAREVEVLRQQISRDLHDQIGSNLCSIRLVAEMGAGPGPGGSEQDALLEIRELAEASTESLRDMVWLLKEGGQPQIRVLVEKMRAVAELLLLKIRWDFRVHGVPRGAVAPLSFHRDLLLIFREALHNVAKHSGAPSVDIEFEWTDGEVILSVADTGCGFGPAGKPSGDGLENMRYRAAQLQGVLLFESRRDGGTRVLLKVPIP